MRVLVFEDSLRFRSDFESALIIAGSQVFHLHDPVGNETLLSRTKPCVIIWNKPLQDAFEKIKAIKEIRNLNHVHLVALTETYDPEITEKAFESGLDDIFLNSLDPKLFAHKMQTVVKRKRPQRIEKCGFQLELNSMRAVFNNVNLKITKTHFFLLVELLKNYPDTALRDVIKNSVFQGGIVTKRTLDVHVSALRKILSPLGYKIDCDRNLGYRLTRIEKKITAA